MLNNNKNLILVEVFQHCICFLKHGIIWALIIAICISSSGCDPALMAGALIALNYVSTIEEQKQRPEPTQRNDIVPTVQVHQPPKAPEPVKQKTPESLIMEARMAYAAFQWDKAQRLFKDILRKRTLARSLRWEALTFLGAMEYQQGNTNEAKEYFLRARKENRTLSPSGELFPPHMIRFYKSAR